MSDILREFAGELLGRARRAGAGQAEVFAIRAVETEVTVRRDQIERVESKRARGTGLRVMLGSKQGFAYTSETHDAAAAELIDAALAAASAAAPDPEAALPEPDLLEDSDDAAGLDLQDGTMDELSMSDRIALASRAEASALSEPGIGNSEGSSFADARVEIVLANTEGLSHQHRATRCTLSSRPVAVGPDGDKQVQIWFSSARHLEDLEAPEQVGRTAAARAARMLGARPVPTCRAAVIFDPLEAGRFWAGLFSAFSGDTVAKGLSFLTRSLGRPIASPLVTLVDDGRIPRGVQSTPRDGEGVPTKRKRVVDAGVLRSFLYDCRTARRADMRTTGNASRGYASAPTVGPLNFHLAPGAHTPEEILRSTRRGLYVTHAIGFGVNVTSGEFSRGANGVWIENGEMTHPVQEVVISGDLQTILKGISMVGNDLTARSVFASPTFKVEEMTIGGR